MRRCKTFSAVLSQQGGEAGGSLIREMPGRADSSPDNDGTRQALPDGAGPASETGRWTRGTSGVKPFNEPASSNPVDLGWIAVRTRALITGRELLDRLILPVKEATVNDCGVAVAMPQGQSWPPHPTNGTQ